MLIAARLPNLAVNRLVLSLRSCSSQLHRRGSDTFPVSEIRFTRSKRLGNIGAPLHFDEDIDSLIEEEVYATTAEARRCIVTSTVSVYNPVSCATYRFYSRNMDRMTVRESEPRPGRKSVKW